MYNVLKTVRVKCPFPDKLGLFYNSSVRKRFDLDKLLKMMRLSGERWVFKGDAKCAAKTKSFRLGGDCLRSQTFLNENRESASGHV